MTNQLTDMKHSNVVLIEGGNPAENHPATFKNVSEARRRGAKLVCVDPRYSRSAACSDLWVPIRPGTDIAFLNGVINYILTHKRYNEEYVKAYTNASWLISDEFTFEDGMFSGFQPTPDFEGKGRSGSYNTKTWTYQTEGEGADWDSGPNGNYAWTQDVGVPHFKLPKVNKVKMDDTLQHPRSVFQLLSHHVSRYTPENVARVCGISEELFNRAAEIISSSYENEKVGSFMYAMGLCQHTVGAQAIRAACMLQLLLGNIGRPGGGVNAMRGECNVQGATDFALLAPELPGYCKLPKASKHPTLAAYLEAFTTSAGYWSNRAKFLISMLKEWYGDYATVDNDYCYDFLPKLNHLDHTHISIFEWMHAGNLKGFFSWGQNPVIGGPNSHFTREALTKLDWLVNVDVWNTDTTTFFNHVDGMKPEEIKTELFFLPACCHYEKAGSVTATGRTIQWRYKAVEPLSGSHDDGDLLIKLWDEIVKVMKDNPGQLDEPVTKLTMDYYKDENGNFDSRRAAMWINGYDLKENKLVKSFTQLKADGSTACGNWIYAGYYCNEDTQWSPATQPCGYRGTDDVVAPGGDGDGLGIYPNWAFSWPVNRKILYNRCSCDSKGKPWLPGRQLVEWDESNQTWTTYDVADFPTNATPDKTLPYMMTGETVSRLFSPALAEGPMPEHYEPIESPFKNVMSKTQSNPLALVYQESSKTKIQTADKYPIISSDFHMVEHWQSGDSTRNQPWLVEIMPRMFVEIPYELAQERGIQDGDWVEVFNERGSIGMHCTVTRRSRPYMIDGKQYYSIMMPFHWGWSSDMCRGAVRNEITPNYGDGNTSTPEFKAFLCDIRKAVKTEHE